MKKNKKVETSKNIQKSLSHLLPTAPSSSSEKYITTIVIETDYYPEELEEGFTSFFMNLSSNPKTKVLKKEIKKGKI